MRIIIVANKLQVEIEETEYDDEATEETAMVDEKPAKKMSICPSSDEKRNSTNKRYSKFVKRVRK
jgi:hypothetical protein